MFVISRLRDLFDDILGPDAALPEGEAHLTLTVAALLVMVARADGTVLEVEETGLHAMLRSRFNLTEEHVARVLDHADEIATELDPAADLAERILQEIGPDERPPVMAMAYRIAALDGYLHEFEEDLLWRIGRLLGLSESEIVLMREDALKNLAPERARDR
jgi:uncharacterized tellurite resistance protein B-like protein